MMYRREFIPAVAGSAVMASVPAHAQRAGKVWRIGWIGMRPTTADPASARAWDDFLGTMRDLGYVEGKNLAFEMRYTEGKSERFPALAADLVRLKVDVIAVGSTPGVRSTSRSLRND